VNKPIDFWKTVLFTDECKFDIFGSDGPQYVWRKPKKELGTKNVIPILKHGGGQAMVWGCMGYAMWENLRFLKGL
jgi:hypothetical protein